MNNHKPYVYSFKNTQNNPEFIILKSNHSKFSHLIDNKWDISDSYFPKPNIQKHIFSNPSHFNGNIIFDTLENVDVKMIRVLLHCSFHQEYLLNLWFDDFITMYNETIKFFKKRRFDGLNIITDDKIIRTYYLKDIKQRILESSKIEIIGSNKCYSINSHILDGAIKDACTSYKSCLTNLENGNIKRFRLRYMNKNKKSKTMRIEKNIFAKSKTTFCKNMLGELNIKLPNNQEIEHDCVLQKIKNNYYLLVPITIKKSITQTKKEGILTGDSGVRTFLTGFNNGHILECNTDLNEFLDEKIKKIDEINESHMLKGSRKKYLVNELYEKIKNRINDSHWKLAKYLTDNYDGIIIGKLSTKEIGQQKWLNKNVKRKATLMRHYVFRQRLAYKCAVKNVKYKCISERYSTKFCSECGYYNAHIRGEKIYKCKKCILKVDRDWNAPKNILIRAL